MDERVAGNEGFREEMLLLGLTLHYCMWFRTYNVFNIAGSVFGNTQPLDKNAVDESELRALGRAESRASVDDVDGLGVRREETGAPRLNRG